MVLKPLTFNNVFGANIDLSSLNYIAPRVTNKPDSEYDIFHQMTLGVESCAPRMISLLGHAQATQILNGLRDEIAMQRVDHEIKFQWDLEMYRNPPINWDPTVAFVSKSTADLDRVRAEAEELVNMEDAGVS